MSQIFNTMYKLIILISIIFGSLSEITDLDRINNIRKSLVDFYSKNANEAYQSDIELVANKDWLINSFLLPHRSNQDVEEAIIKSLKFWKDIEISSYNDTYFPSEMIATGTFYRDYDANNNNIVLGYVGQCYIQSSMLNPYFFEISRKHIYYYYRHTIFHPNKNNIIVVISFANFSIVNNNIGIIVDVLNMVINNSPNLLSKILVIDVGLAKYVFQPFIAVARNHFTETLTFISRNELQQYVSLESLPIYAGGTDSSYRRMPEGVRSGKCLQQFRDKISPQEWDQYRDKNIDCILNGLEESKMSSLEEYLKYC